MRASPPPQPRITKHQAIACRQDLEPNLSDRYPFGALDAKVSRLPLAQRSPPVIFARLGPSTASQPPFCWAPFEPSRNKRGKVFSHAGHPQCFDFPWQVMPPQKESDVGKHGQL